MDSGCLSSVGRAARPPGWEEGLLSECLWLAVLQQSGVSLAS